MTDVSHPALLHTIRYTVYGVTSQQRQTDFQIQPELNKEGKTQFCKLAPSSWLIPGNGSSQGQEDRKAGGVQRDTGGGWEECCTDVEDESLAASFQILITNPNRATTRGKCNH